MLTLYIQFPTYCVFFLSQLLPLSLGATPTTPTPHHPNLQSRRVKVCCNYSGHFKEEKLFEKIEILARTLAVDPGPGTIILISIKLSRLELGLDLPPLRTSGFTFLSLIHKFLGYYSDSGSGGGGGGNTFITS